MRKLRHLFTTALVALTLLLWGNVGMGQGLEDFTNSALTASYADGSFVGNAGITWTYVASRDDNGTQGVNAPALMFKGDLTAKVTSSTIPGGIGNLTVKLYKAFTGAGDRQVELFVNGISKGISVPFD
ncbi:MAG: hypothetical protein PHD06_02505, partial [Bacteroidales bacterium]|nr:hypothetical protein [Bacteroidales bacterium]